MRSKNLTNKKQKIFSEKQKDLGMAYHTPPLKKVKKQGEMPLPSLGPILVLGPAEFYVHRGRKNAAGPETSPIPSLNSTFF